MKFDLIINKTLNILPNFHYEIYESDSLVEIFGIIEEAIYENHCIDFYFECLKERWNVTIFGDLSVFMEQLNSMFELTKNVEGQYLLDFYEVGTNRKLLIIKTEKQIRIENKSEDKWKSPIQYELEDSAYLRENIISFVDKTKNIIDKICPTINELSVLQNWYQNFKTNF